jgi:shikimate kinase
MKVYLIGLPGSGKSFLGKKLAEEARVPFIDLDKVIEQEAGISISKIFSEKGEEYFRNLEAVALRQHSKAMDFVMACGGGTPCFHDNMKFINESGTSIFLNTSLKEIIHRLQATGEKEVRPLLTGSLEQKLRDLLLQRISFYRQAPIILDHAVPPAELLQIIIKK